MLGKAIGIDFGTSSIKFYKNGEGIILHEKSVIAIYNKSHTFAVGNEAYEMYEKAPGKHSGVLSGKKWCYCRYRKYAVDD